MPVTTDIRRRVVDMLPEYLTKRSATFGPKREALLRESGVTSDVLGTLVVSFFLVEGDVIRADRYSWRSPYATKRPNVLDGWTQVVDAGLAEPVQGGWRLKPAALALAEKGQRALRDHLRSLSLPTEPVRRAANALEPIADRIPASAERAALVRRLRPKPEEPKADILRLNRAAAELWYWRDDSHIGAWQDAGYEGPVFDVLSFIWQARPDMSWTKQAGSGATSVDGLADALKQRQERADVERAVALLEKRGDVERDGDALRLTAQGQTRREAIEDETDRRFFAIWHLDDAATAQLGEDLRAVIDALPAAS